MLAAALLISTLAAQPNFDHVVFTVDDGAAYADVALKVQRRFPHATISRGVDHEVLSKLGERAVEDGVDVMFGLDLVRRFVHVSPGTHATSDVLAFVKGFAPAAYVSGPVMPGLPPAD